MSLKHLTFTKNLILKILFNFYFIYSFLYLLYEYFLQSFMSIIFFNLISFILKLHSLLLKICILIFNYGDTCSVILIVLLSILIWFYIQLSFFLLLYFFVLSHLLRHFFCICIYYVVTIIYFVSSYLKLFLLL